MLVSGFGIVEWYLVLSRKIAGLQMCDGFLKMWGVNFASGSIQTEYNSTGDKCTRGHHNFFYLMGHLCFAAVLFVIWNWLFILY